MVSEVLPKELFIGGKNTPLSHGDWVKHHSPLTYWHVTHFEPESKGELGYSCVGVTFSHGLLDGMGIAFVIHALEAEMLGQPWEVPPLPHAGLNTNVMLLHLENFTEEAQKKEASSEYFAISVLGIWAIISYLLFHAWQYWWHGARRKMILVPEAACKILVADARKALAENGNDKIRVSTGDVLAAWLLKVSECLLLESLDKKLT